jgi:hypothetical protein
LLQESHKNRGGARRTSGSYGRTRACSTTASGARDRRHFSASYAARLHRRLKRNSLGRYNINNWTIKQDFQFKSTYLNPGAKGIYMTREEIQKVLLAEIHKSIEEVATFTIEMLGNSSQDIDLTYPPNNTLTPEEKIAIQGLVLPDAARSALKKIILDTASVPIFRLFSLMDGVTDPETDEIEVWLGLTFCPKSVDEETEDNDLMLHDKLFESYWEYKKVSN